MLDVTQTYFTCDANIQEELWEKLFRNGSYTHRHWQTGQDMIFRKLSFSLFLSCGKLLPFQKPTIH